MRVVPTEKEVKEATELLTIKYNISFKLIYKLFGKEHINKTKKFLKKVDERDIKREDIAKLLILKSGPQLFGGSHANVIKLRLNLLKKLPDLTINELYEKHTLPRDRTLNDPSRERTYLSEMKWHPSGPWPKHFVMKLGFPEIFAGVHESESPATIEQVAPKPPPLSLKPSPAPGFPWTHI